MYSVGRDSSHSYIQTFPGPPLAPPDVDSPMLSSAFIFFPGITSEESINVTNRLDFMVDTMDPSRIRLTARNVMAPIEDFEVVLRSIVYSTTREM